MDKKTEIVTAVLNIPLERWNGDVAELNGAIVKLERTHTNLAKYFIIDGVEFYDKRIHNFITRLDDFREKKRNILIDNQIDEIYKSICLNHQTNL